MRCMDKEFLENEYLQTLKYILYIVLSKRKYRVMSMENENENILTLWLTWVTEKGWEDFWKAIIKINLFMHLLKHHCRVFPLHLILPPVWKDMSWQCV